MDDQDVIAEGVVVDPVGGAGTDREMAEALRQADLTYTQRAEKSVQ